MTKEEKKNLITQKHKVDLIRNAAFELFCECNTFENIAQWAIDNDTLNEQDKMQLSWKKTKEHFNKLQEILK